MTEEEIKKLAEEEIVPCEPYKDDTVEWYCCSFKIKDGEKIHIRAS